MRAIFNNAGARWKMLLVLLFSSFLGGMSVSFLLAAQRVSQAVPGDGATSGARIAGQSWRISASLEGADLRVRVRDESGAPVSGGSVRLEPGPQAPAFAGVLKLRESSPGTFHATLPRSAGGELHGTLRFTRGDAFTTQKLVLFN